MNLFPEPDQTIEGASEALRARRTTGVALVERCLAEIDRQEQSLQAWVLVDREGALARAREMDAAAASGKWAGALHGIPIAIKDVVDVAGWPTEAGSPLRASQVAAKDAPIVRNLREAGAVILGKTVTTQFACFDPPATRNPWNPERTPGGSSSGSAAAVAAGMCLGAVGSQTGGSITRPASFCGVAGCKPTFGLVSLEGIVPVTQNLDHPGPIARSVRGLATMLAAMIGRSLDPVRDDGPPPTLGILSGFFEDRAAADMRRALGDAVDRMRRAGATTTAVPLPPAFDDVIRQHRTIMACEAAAYHDRDFREHRDAYLPKLTGMLDEGFAASAIDYLRAIEHQRRAKSEIGTCFQNVNALVCPATTGEAPETSTTGDPTFNSPWSYTGLPTVSFPIALGDHGLPLAIQLVGKPSDEADLFRVAAWCERVLCR